MRKPSVPRVSSPASPVPPASSLQLRMPPPASAVPPVPTAERRSKVKLFSFYFRCFLELMQSTSDSTVHKKWNVWLILFINIFAEFTLFDSSEYFAVIFVVIGSYKISLHRQSNNLQFSRLSFQRTKTMFYPNNRISKRRCTESVTNMTNVGDMMKTRDCSNCKNGDQAETLFNCKGGCTSSSKCFVRPFFHIFLLRAFALYFLRP